MKFVKETRIAAAPEQVFAFYESPGALQRLTPPWETVEILEDGGSIQPGSRVVMRTRVGPIGVRWVAEHTEYERGRMFADRQVSGPFSSWYHRHWFLDDGQGGTLLRDEIEFEPPLGALASC
jgi:ligand-binding SRPBCC domain-containing protein